MCMSDFSFFSEMRNLDQPELSPLVGAWFAPKIVEIDGANLIWFGQIKFKKISETRHVNIAHESNHLVIPDPKKPFETLRDFIGLDQDQTGDRILRYARRWGVLSICEHGLPSSHSLRQPVMEKENGEYMYPTKVFPNAYVSCRPLERADGMFYEPLELWRLLAQQVKAILHLGKQLHTGNPIRQEDWQALRDWFHILKGSEQEDQAKFVLSHVVNHWLDMTGVRPQFFWSKSRTHFVLSNPNVFQGSRLLAALAVQMTLMLNRSSGYALCASCGKPFPLRKGQSIRRDVYCSSVDCGTKAARREATKRYRQRVRTIPTQNKKVGTLSKEAIKSIRSKLEKAERPRSKIVKELAKKHGVSESTIYKIEQRILWPDIE